MSEELPWYDPKNGFGCKDESCTSYNPLSSKYCGSLKMTGTTLDKTYTEADLVSFGNFLGVEVTHADLENWKHSKTEKK